MAKSAAVLYATRGRVATLTLNRPAHLNAISAEMPGELESAVARAVRDDAVRVIVVEGAGRAFCAGYDLKAFAERGDLLQDTSNGYDAFSDFAMMGRCTAAFMSLFHSPKPTIAKVRGPAVGGGSDIALCCDLVVMADCARIGYPPSRVWGCPTTAMWAVRVGAERAKRILFTGDTLSGKEAAACGLVSSSHPEPELDAAVAALSERIASVPSSHLWFHKCAVHTACGLDGRVAEAQRLSTVFDGIARHSPEGLAFVRMAQAGGFKAAVAARDAGAVDWSDLAAADRERRRQPPSPKM